MKKNILTIVILALALINLVLTSLIVFVVVPTSSKTNKIITDVASIINLELDDGANKVKVTDIENYTIEDKLILNLKHNLNEDKQHYVSLKLSLSMNKKNEDYEKLKPQIETNVTQITEIVSNVFSKYSLTEAQNNKDKIKQEVLEQIQTYFGSDFIINVAFGGIIYE